MAELTYNVVRVALRGVSVTERDYLASEELYNVVSRLEGGEFDEETFEEIWDQCKLNSKGEVRISDFIDVLLKGEALLVEKQQENTQEIAKLDADKKGKIADFADQLRFKEQMDALQEEKLGIANSLAIVRKPFLPSADAPLRPEHHRDSAPNPNELKEEIVQDDIVRQMFEYDSSQSAGTLQTILHLLVCLVGLTWAGSLFLCQFWNLMVYSVMLGQFAFQVVSRKLVKLNLLLLLAATLLDLLWLIFRTGPLWYPPQAYDLTRNIASYLKFSVIAVIIAATLRLVLMYYYLSQYYIDEFQVYSLSFLGKDLNLQREHEPFTPNKNPYSYFLDPYFNKTAIEGEQLQ